MRARTAVGGFAVLSLCLTGPAAGAGRSVAPDPRDGGPWTEGFLSCDITPHDSVDNGMGAEPGVVREFAAGITVPPECSLGGKTWVTRIFVSTTRTAGGPEDVPLDLAIRPPQTTSETTGPPLPGAKGYILVDAVNTSTLIFPNETGYFHDTQPPGRHDPRNILWGNYHYVSASLDGDQTANAFVVADQTGPPGQIPCFTGINHQIPIDNCLNGNPLLNAPGLGASTAQYFGRSATRDLQNQFSGSSEPFGGGYTFYGRYTSGLGGNAPVGSVDVSLTEGEGGPVICSFPSMPEEFTFECPLTLLQQELLDNGGVFGESSFVSEPVRLVGADDYVFSDGFESGDTAAWDATVD